jgi:hypothetical protein
MHAPRKQKWQEKFKRSGYLFGAILFHLILFFMLATLVIWPAPPPPPTAEFRQVAIKTPPPPVQPPTPGEAANNPDMEPQPVVVPVVTPPSVIITDNSTFKVNATETLHQPLNLSQLMPQGTGMGKGGSGDGNGPGLIAQLSKLLFQLPCLSYNDDGSGNCVLTDDHNFVVHIPDGQVHTCNLRVRGVVEQNTYQGGKEIKDFLNEGGTPSTTGYNIYELNVDDPPQTYYLNAGTSGINSLFVIDYPMHIDVKDGSKVTLHADSGDSREVANSNHISVPDKIPEHLIAVKQPYDGQFIQVDTISIDE